MSTQGITQILVAPGIAVLICIMIFYAGYAIGKYVQALTVQAQLENISEQALTIQTGLQTLRKELNLLQIEDK